MGVTHINHNRPKSFGFLLLDDYPLLPVSGMIDTLRDTEYVTGIAHFDWNTISIKGDEVVAMNELKVAADFSIGNAPEFDAVIVCAGLNGHLIDEPSVTNWLRKQYANKTMIGSIATGSWVLAKAGLLTNRRCTVHWEEIPAFEESYPLLEVSHALYVFDGPIFTCSGGTAAIDMFLKIISDDLGPEVSAKVAEQILHQSSRVGSDHPPVDDSPYKRIRHRSVRQALKLMRENTEDPISIREISLRSNISQKQLERLFLSAFQKTPQNHYRDMRIEYARTLVRLTDIGIWKIAIIVGFSSAQYFAKCYREKFGMSPSEERKALQKFENSRPGV